MTQEADQQHEHDAENELPCGAEMQRRLEKVAQIKPDRGADQRTEQRAGAADRGLHHQLPRRVEREGVGWHEALHDAKEPAGKPRIGGGDDEGCELIAVDVMADRGGAQRIIADGAQDGADRRAHDSQRDHQANEVPERQKRVELGVAVKLQRGEAERQDGRWHARQPVLAARIGRERIELDEEEHFGDRHGDHGEIDAGTPQRDQPDQEPDDRGRDHADKDAGDDVADNSRTVSR